MYQEKPAGRSSASMTTKIEEEDQCYTCEYFCKGVSCPLLEALAVGVATLTDEVQVKNCGFYVEFKRKLAAVPQKPTKESKKDEPKTRRK